MIITILTMFPELFGSFLEGPIAKRATEKQIARIRLIDIKDYAGGCYRHIDDSTFGGGAGMVLRAQPVLNALDAALCPEDGELPGTESGSLSGRTENAGKPQVPESGKRSLLAAALTPVGHRYCQETAQRYAQLDHLILVCGHYEGMDERIYAHVDERISIGDYILSGGEFAAQVVVDSVLRLLPGVLRAESTREESFCGRGLLEYPQYTRPADLNGERVPDVLLSGNHEEIRTWRLRESLRATREYRPELLREMELTAQERQMLEELGPL